MLRAEQVRAGTVIHADFTTDPVAIAV